MHLTSKQVELLTVIIKGNGSTHADLDQIIERVRYTTTKQSMQFSIRALIKHGLVEKKPIEKIRGRQRVTIAPTEKGKKMLNFEPTTFSSPSVLDESVFDSDVDFSKT
jgi:DNA-binding MarR family transcriptional regulator